MSNSSPLGGGIAFTQNPATGANPVLTNTVVLANYAGDKGSGIYVEASAPRFWHTTIARNTGGENSGIHVTNADSNFGSVALTNTILVSHSLQWPSADLPATTSASMACSSSAQQP